MPENTASSTAPQDGSVTDREDTLDFQTSLRLHPEMRQRIDDVATAMKEDSGFPAKRSTVIRMSIERGLDDLEREYLKPKSPFR